VTEIRFQFALKDAKAVADRAKAIEEACREYVAERSSVPPKP
jgi:hypothetical protein